MSARELTDEERRLAAKYCDAAASNSDHFPALSAQADRAAARAWMVTDDLCRGHEWYGAAALLRAGWSPGETLSVAHLLAAAVAVAHRLLAETGADVAIRCDVTPAVGAALAGPVRATYVIAATGDAP